jgi:hypothetical protein
MNARAKKHLAKAKDYLAKGDQFYRKAKPEIDAALNEGASLREVSRFLDRSKDWVADVRDWDGVGTLYAKDTERRQTDQAKQVLRSTPEVVAKLDPAEQRELIKVLDRESVKRQKERERISDEKFREVMGEETADDLELAQALKDTEWYLVKGHQDSQSFLKAANRLGVENTPDRWRESCLSWIEAIENDLGMAKALLQGDDVDWTAFDDMLKEVK